MRKRRRKPMRKPQVRAKAKKVKWVKEMSRERTKAPRTKVKQDKRRKNAEDLARAIAGRFGEEI